MTSSANTSSVSSFRTAFNHDDYTHPYHHLYVHPCDILGSSLVSVPFDGTGCGSWRRTILVTLFVRNKLDFIKAISNRPPENSQLCR